MNLALALRVWLEAYHSEHLTNFVLRDAEVCEIYPSKCMEGIVNLLRNSTLRILGSSEELLERNHGKAHWCHFDDLQNVDEELRRRCSELTFARLKKNLAHKSSLRS
jgi:hypothetical protein